MKTLIALTVALALSGAGVDAEASGAHGHRGYSSGYSSWIRGYHQTYEREYYMGGEIGPDTGGIYGSCASPRCRKEAVEESKKRMDEWCTKFPMICESDSVEEVFNYAK